MLSLRRGRLVVFFLFACLLFRCPAEAGVNKWTRIGLDNRLVATLVADPGNPLILYAGTADDGGGYGVFKTTDGGLHWEQVGKDLLDSEGRASVTRLQVNPHDPSNIYALLETGGLGVFKSTDGGASWAPWTTAPGRGPICFHPYQPDTLFVPVTQGVAKSTDGGASWRTILRGLGTYGLRSVQFAPDGTFVALGYDRVYKTYDGGENWVEWLPYRALCLKYDPNDPFTIYLGQEPGGQPGILKSTDGGASWYDYSQGFWKETPYGFLNFLPGENFWFDPLDPTHVYAVAQQGGVFTTFDRGNNWTSTGLEAGPFQAPLVQLVQSSLLVANGSHHTIYVGYQHNDMSQTPFDHSGVYAYTYAPDVLVPDLTIAVDPLQDGSSTFAVGGSARYRMTVTNNGTGGTAGPITVASLLPSGMSFTSQEGASWNCAAAGSSVTCTRTAALAPGASDNFYLRVEVGHGAAGIVTSKAVVDTPGENDSADNVAYGTVTVSKDAGDLYLHEGRFKVDVTWQTPNGSGEGTARVMSTDSGYFWFFDPTNMELLVKVLDGRSVNQHFWVFYGALTDVEFTLTIRDLVTGSVRTYHNNQGTLASFHDINAFPGAANGAAMQLDVLSGGPRLNFLTGQAADLSLIAHWKFDDLANLALDSSAYGHDMGTMFDTSFDAAGRVGGCVSLVEGYPNHAMGVVLDAPWNGPMTVSAWVNLAEENTDNGNALLTNGMVFELFPSMNNFGGRIGGFFWGSGVDTGAQVSPGVWHHLTLTYDGELTRFFLDGQGVCTVKQYIEARRPLWDIGASEYGGSEDFAGKIDEMRLYDRALTPEEVASLYSEAASTSNLVLDSRFTVRVDWTTAGGATGTGYGVPLSTDSGYFWFFDKANAELLVKVLDGRSVNGKFWVFFAALTDVGYTLTITDNETGAVKTYQGQQGVQKSGYDLNAF